MDGLAARGASARQRRTDHILNSSLSSLLFFLIFFSAWRQDLVLVTMGGDDVPDAADTAGENKESRKDGSDLSPPDGNVCDQQQEQETQGRIFRIRCC